jgi:arabinogalactan oligomer / maltooligosaccharide transport system permease protein
MRIAKAIQQWLTSLFTKLKALPRQLYLSIRNVIQSIRHLLTEFKNNPNATKTMLLSAVLMGLGQFKNKQHFKGYFFLGIFLFFVGIEIATSRYLLAFTEIAEYPDDFGIIFLRDYGGLILRGLWGFFTLGELVVFDFYRGGTIRLQDNVLPFRSADISNVLLGQGIIVLVMLLFLAAVYIAQLYDAYSVAKKIDRGEEVENFQSFRHRALDDYFAYIIVLPAGLLILFLTLVPFLFSFLIAFTNYTSQIQMGAELFNWVGFENFGLYLLQPEWFQYFWNVFSWTLLWAIMASVTVYFLGFLQALVVNSRYIKYKKFTRLVMIIPWAIPGLVSLLVFRNVFSAADGLANLLLVEFDLIEPAKQLFRSLGLLGQPEQFGIIVWFNEPGNGPLAKVIVVLVNLWMGAPYFMLLITGILGTIPAELYEAADIDGASDTQKFRFVTWPWVLRATMPIIITTFTFNFNNFGAIYFLTGGGPGYPFDSIPQSIRLAGSAPGQTDILISWIYKIAFNHNPQRYNLASTYSIVIFVVIGIFAIYNLSRVKGFWEEE